MDEQCYDCGHHYPEHFLKKGLCDECWCWENEGKKFIETMNNNAKKELDEL